MTKSSPRCSSRLVAAIRLIAALATSGAVACEDEFVESASTEAPKPAAKKAEPKKAEKVAAPEFQESDFTETDRSRDPFRSFERTFNESEKDRIRNQREVVLGEYSVDELKLIAIVGRLRPARAMLVDPKGMGHVVMRGQYLGAPEVVRGGASNADYEINWRVDNIRDNDIVLVREDPANPDVPSATRIIMLRPDETVSIR